MILLTGNRDQHSIGVMNLQLQVDKNKVMGTESASGVCRCCCMP